MQTTVDLPEDQQIYRYWIELRDRRDGSVRDLPLHGLRKIHLLTKKDASRLPDELVLQVEDGTGVIMARDIDDVAAQLRLKYPDGAFERVLRRERDHEAEERRAEAMDSLLKILAKTVLDDLQNEEAGLHEDPTCGEPDSNTRVMRKQRRSKRSRT